MLPPVTVCTCIYKIYVNKHFIITFIIILFTNLFVLIPLHKYRFFQWGNMEKGFHVAEQNLWCDGVGWVHPAQDIAGSHDHRKEQRPL